MLLNEIMSWGLGTGASAEEVEPAPTGVPLNAALALSAALTPLDQGRELAGLAGWCSGSNAQEVRGAHARGVALRHAAGAPLV